MQFVVDAPNGKTWFRIETEAEAMRESEIMRHAVEKYFRIERERAAQTYRPASKTFFEQEIGLNAHLRQTMPLFLTLAGTRTAMLMSPPCCRRAEKTIRASASSSSARAMPILIRPRPMRSRRWAITLAWRSRASAAFLTGATARRRASLEPTVRIENELDLLVGGRIPVHRPAPDVDAPERILGRVHHRARFAP